MGLRSLLCLMAAVLTTASGQSQSGQPQALAYQPPIALGAPVPSAPLQNSYQPPISLIRSNEYQSPLNQPLSSYQPVPANAVPGTTYQSGPHTYVLQPLPHNHHHSVQYVPPRNQQFSAQPATSYSVHQSQPQGVSQGQSSSSISVLAGPPQQSTAERTYSSSSHSKVVGSSHVPAQAIHKAPASEIQGSKDPALAAKEKDKAAANDEYVVYYYYYYDNDTAASNNTNNPSLNFDDIPSLEAYDNDAAKEPAKQLSANSLAPDTTSSSSQPRSVGGGGESRLDVQPPIKPVSNVFRYGSNEVPRFPVLPNFVVTEVPTTTTRPELAAATEPPVARPAAGHPDLRTGEDDEDDLDSNNVLDNGADLKSNEDQEPTTTTTTTTSTTTTTTTTEPPTTTEEEPTTTTERSRRRNPLGGGGRRRFNPTSSFSSSRNRPSSSTSSSSSSSGRSTSSTTSTTSTTTSAPTRRSFQGNRIRPRPPISNNRPRPGSRTTASHGATTEAGEDRSESTTSSSTVASRSRFTSAAPRRFQSSRSRSSSSQSTSSRSSTTSSTTSTTRSPIPRSRPPPAANRPRPNLISRNRPPRPGFFRPRPGSEPEEPDTTTPAPLVEETSPVSDSELPSTDENNEENETDRDNETDETDEEEESSTPTTTTEASRFSALFRPRNRNALGNRPRPVIGNRPSRS